MISKSNKHETNGKLTSHGVHLSLKPRSTCVTNSKNPLHTILLLFLSLLWVWEGGIKSSNTHTISMIKIKVKICIHENNYIYI